jgi:hypothetical protein
MQPPPSPGEVTTLLQAWSEGDEGARDRLMPLVYQELRRRAAGVAFPPVDVGERQDAGEEPAP